MLAYCLLILVVAQVARLVGGSVSLMVGTIVVGAMIGGGNVALPALIKRWFPDRIPLATAWSTLALVMGAAIASGIALPIEDALDADWRTPMLIFAIPAGAIAISWLLLSLRENAPVGGTRVAGVWRNRLAWQVTMYMAVQAVYAYAIMVWLPTVVIDRGLEPAQGGAILALSMAGQAVGSLTLPLLTGRTEDERPAVVVTSLLPAVGLVGLILSPTALIWIPSLIVGIGIGSSFALALALIGLRSPNERVAGELSGMVQSIGYMVGGLGPLGVGALRTLSGGWTLPILVVLAFCLLLIPVGLPAARRRFVEPGPAAPEEG
jgi:cyanate permease